jgi:hypothetical protein
MKTKIAEWSSRFIHFKAIGLCQCLRWYMALTLNIATMVTV